MQSTESISRVTEPESIITSSHSSVSFLQDNNGNSSSMRLMSLIALITAIICGGYTLYKPEVKDVGINLTFSFLVSAFAPKAVQKFAENKTL